MKNSYGDMDDTEITKNTYPIKLRDKRQFGIYHEGLLFERVV